MTEIRDRFNSIRFAYTQNIQMPPNGLNTDWCLKGKGVWVLHQFWLDSDLIDSVIWFTSSLLDGCLHLCFRFSLHYYCIFILCGVWGCFGVCEWCVFVASGQCLVLMLDLCIYNKCVWEHSARLVWERWRMMTEFDLFAGTTLWFRAH